MDPRDLPVNSMMLRFDILNTGDLKIIEAQHFGDDISDEEAFQYVALMKGLVTIMNLSSDFVIALGGMTTLIETLEGMEDDTEILFEPDDELVEAIADAKVINLKDRMN